MGATAHFKSLSPWGVAFLQENSFLTEAFVCWEDPVRSISPWKDSLSQEQRRSLDERLELAFPQNRENFGLEIAARQSPAQFSAAEGGLERLKAEWETPSLDLDKTWRGIVADLDSFPSELAGACRDALRGGVELGPDLGYGRAHLLDPREVLAIAELLPRAVGHYQEAHGYFARELEYLSTYYSDAARQGRGMLLHLA
jgi:uncharacterized protein DUF1877